MSAESTGSIPADSSVDRTLDQLRLAARDGAHSSAEFEQDVSNLRRRLDIELARVARSRNSALSLQARLPDELWCLVWQDLPLIDQLAILRVCHAWRTLALASSSVWSTVDVNLDLHHYDCHCEPCREDRQDFRKRYLVSNTIPSTKTNLHLIPRALSLGKNVPLTIEISDIASNSNDDAYEYLGELLQLHAHRLRAMHLDLQDSWVTQHLLEAVEPLNALQTFSVTCSAEPCNVHEPHHIATRAIACPRLQYLRLPKCLLWQQGFEDSMTALRDLWCGVQSLSDIAFILDVCVNLSCLTLDLHEELDHPEDPAMTPATLHRHVHERARALKDVAFRGVTSRNEIDILAIFGIPEVETLNFLYLSHHGPTSEAADNLTAHFRNPMALSCTSSPKGLYYRFGLLATRRTPEKGPTRAISQESNALLLQQTWGHLSKCLPQAVVVEGPVWRALHTDSQLDPMPNTLMFTVLVSSAPELAEPPLLHHYFPQLRLICLRGSGASEVIVTAETIVAFVDSVVAPGSFLDSLVLELIRIEGDDSALRRRAATVLLPHHENVLIT
ncbi:hypothetical protein EXIGLDRAFT_764278 [Exidia glandulosa HHB12029]|uniref:Uncharacterized protein n=1 Tax=Exidia glandulosa HHB12029 TaxID=1314781 RepID=A0A165LB50_EXIGL|nr:hypothetical protein EXIGLDRAFT_764278 [Exidia glandulosa HHB12029]